MGAALGQERAEWPGKEGESWQRERVRQRERGRREGLGLLAAVGRQEAEALFRTFSFCCPSSMAGLRF